MTARLRNRLALLSALVLLGGARLSACGPGIPYPAWSYSYSPDDRESFLGGEVGVLLPDFDKNFLYLAYRHLTGLGLDEASLESVSELWGVKEHNPWAYDSMRQWHDALRQVTGERSSPRYWPVQLEIKRPDGQYGGYFINCSESAFYTAAATLRARADHYGKDAPQLAEWITAQKTVFGNCGGGSSIPDRLDASSGSLAHADRTYQLAAAHFYARQYERAAELFAEIAADRASPWSNLSAYLVARCLIRSSTVGFEPRAERFTRARAALDAVLADETRLPVHDIARGLRQYVDLRIDPEGSRRHLRERLTAPSLGSTLRQDLIDYFWLLRRLPDDRLEAADELDQWLIAFRQRRQPTMRQLAAERAADSELWLAAAITVVEPRDPWAAGVLDAAQGVAPTSPVYPTVLYHAARIRSQSGAVEQARDTVAGALPDVEKRLSPGDRNRFSLLLAELAPTLDERIEHGRLVPLAYTWFHERRGDHPLAQGWPRLRSFAGQPLPADVAVDALNLSAPARLRRLLEGETLDQALRRRLAPAAWTRAALFADEAEALALSQLAAAVAPELTEELDRYRQAATGEERLFSAAWTILRFPGLRPTLRHGFGRFGVDSFWEDAEIKLSDFSALRDNWWCSDPLHGLEPHQLRSLADEERDEAEHTLRQLKSLPPAPAHLGNIILAWAETRPRDPRIPEALHRLVRATRVCPAGDFSRVAFQTLHRRYPQSPWAKKTKYWYK